MTENTMTEIGKRIRRRRKELGLSQAELASRIPVSPSHMSDIENGKKNLGLSTFVRITEELGTSADWLIRAETPVTAAVVSSEIEELLADCTAEESQEMFLLLGHLKEFLHRRR